MSESRILLVALITAVFASTLHAQTLDRTVTVDEPFIDSEPLTATNGAQVLTAFIDGYTKSAMVRENSPSGTVALAVNGELIFSKGYGYQDVSERIPVIAETTLFRPGSTSKLFTWVAVMQQVEQ